MNNPCHYCVQPERHPGCHDHCEKLKAFRESDEYIKYQKYKEETRCCAMAPSARINRTMRYYKHKGMSLGKFKII